MKDENRIVMSVIILTYNHEAYIVQALDSVLMQKTDFPFEIIVGDDCSTDGTQRILKEYNRRHPGAVKLILRKRNLGVMKNSFLTAHRALGEYMIVLEGDDYWTSRDKLQKQVDFLRKNPMYSGCSHKFQTVDRYGKVYEDRDFERQYTKKEVYDGREFEAGVLAGHTSTLTYKNIFKSNQLRDLFCKYKFKSGDWIVNLILLSQGNIYCMEDVMSHYRKVTDADSASYSALQKQGNERFELFASQVIIERYSKNTLGLDLNFSRRKKDVYLSAIFKFMREPEKRNLSVVMKIIRASGQPVSYITFGIRMAAKKIYYKIRYKEDRRVEY